MRAPGGCAIAREALRRSRGAGAVDCTMLLLAACCTLWPWPGIEAGDATRCVGVPIEFKKAEEPRTVPAFERCRPGCIRRRRLMRRRTDCRGWRAVRTLPEP